jgi:predicted metal-dependent hydrolase
VDSELYLRGIDLFNRGEFFEAHEVLEDVWRAALPADKKFLQGLIQISVAFVHHSRGNVVGARSLLARGCRNLSACPAFHRGIHLQTLISSTEKWRAALETNTVPPPLVTIVVDRIAVDRG